MKHLTAIGLAALLLAGTESAAGQPNLVSRPNILYAYYTRVDSGESFEKFARVNQYADVIVKLGKRGGTQ